MSLALPLVFTWVIKGWITILGTDEEGIKVSLALPLVFTWVMKGWITILGTDEEGTQVSLIIHPYFTGADRLVGPVVKASASREEDPGFESRLRRDFSGVEAYQCLNNWYSSGYPARRLAL